MALSKKMLAIVAVLVVILALVIAAAAMGGGDTKASNDGSNDQNDNQDNNSTGATPGAGADVKIFEVESNPAGTDAGNEWLIIKNLGNSPVNVTGWKLYSTGGSNEAKTLSGTVGANETLKVNFADQFLDNEGEVVKLYSADNVLVDQTISISDTGNDSGTWVRP